MDYMLIKKPYGDDDGNTGGIIWDAADAVISETINGDISLSFTIPAENEFKVTLLSRICLGDDEFIVEKMSLSDNKYTVTATQRFVFEAKRAHIPSVCSTDDGDYIGVDPYTVIEAAMGKLETYGGTACEMFSDTEISAAGYTKLDDVLVDFEAADKTTLWDVLTQLIEKAGRGEIYCVGTKFALVERIGTDNNALIADVFALEGVAVDRDCSETVTKLYPYGDDSIDITSASKNTDKTPYILSPNADTDTPEHAPVAGYKNYELADVDDLYERALWEFDSANPNRIDVPTVNISGTAAELMLAENLRLGDTVHVMYNGDVLHERVVKRTWYPLSGKPSELEIGRVKRDMFFYLNQVGLLAKRYKNISTTAGVIYGAKITGSIRLDGKLITSDTSGNLYFNGKQLKFA